MTVKSPGGATQWHPDDPAAQKLVPDAFDPNVQHPPMMFTTDVSLKVEPAFRATVERYSAHPDQFRNEFADVWFKLTHRDLGPKSRYLGSEIPAQDFVWQDPVPAAPDKLISQGDIRDLKRDILASGLTVPQLVRTAWAAAASFRNTDWRGGANGGRLALAPQRSGAVNDPQELAVVLPKLEATRDGFNRSHDSRPVSLADLIVLGGNAAVEKAAADGGLTLDPDVVWAKADPQGALYVGKDRAGTAVKWRATPVDLIFGYNTELRAVAGIYAMKGDRRQFVDDFGAAWTKVMNNDRF